MLKTGDNRIAAQFETFKADVIPAAAPPVQVQEMRRAFYAGAHAMMTVLNVVTTDGVSDEEGEAILEDADQELRRFAKDVLEGKA